MIRLIYRLFYLKHMIKTYATHTRHRVLCWYIRKYRSNDVCLLCEVLQDHLQPELPHMTRVEQFYMLYPGYGIRPDGSKTAICWDAPIAIIIHLDKKPAFGIGLELYGKGIHIKQLQGIKGFRFSRSSEDWAKKSVRALHHCLANSYVNEVRLYRAHTKQSYRTPQLSPSGLSREACQEKMRKRYDRTAEDLEMRMTDLYGSWTD